MPPLLSEALPTPPGGPCLVPSPGSRHHLGRRVAASSACPLVLSQHPPAFIRFIQARPGAVSWILCSLLTFPPSPQMIAARQRLGGLIARKLSAIIMCGNVTDHQERAYDGFFAWNLAL